MRLPNGLFVFNVTPHPLHFLCGDGVVTVPPDDVVNVLPWTTLVRDEGAYTLNTVTFLPTPEGREIVDNLKTLAPDALIVGSILAAQAYPGEVVAPVPAYSDRRNKVKQEKRVMRSDRFTIFNKETSNVR